MIKNENTKTPFSDILESKGLSKLAFSKDGKMASVSFLKNSDIKIMKVNDPCDFAKWSDIGTITDFGKSVIYMEWSVNNKLLAVSLDNNCLIIEQDKKNSKKWVAHMVVMESQYRSLQSGSWSHDGKTFAVGGGNKSLYIGFWDNTMRLYTTERLKKASKSCIMSLAFHPKDPTCIAYTGVCGNLYLTTFKFIVEETIAKDGNKYQHKKIEVITDGKESLKSWGNQLCWSPSGNTISIVCQGNTVYLLQINGIEIKKNKKTQLIGLPLTHCFYNGEKELTAIGYDGVPFKFALSGDKWSLTGAYQTGCGGFKRVANYKNVEKNQRTHDMKRAAKQLDFCLKYTVSHEAEVRILTPCKKEGATYFYSGDLKGNLIAWKFGDAKKA